MSPRLLITTTLVAPLAMLVTGPSVAAGTLDQQTTVNTGSAGDVLSTSPDLGQVFTAGMSGNLSSAAFHLYELSTSPSVTQHLYAVDPLSSLPTGSPLASAAVTVAPGGWQWVETSFPTPVSVVAGTQYALVLTSTDAIPKSRWARANAYAGGSGIYGTGGVWLQFSGGSAGDLTFRTYVTTASLESPQALPGPIVQQVGAIGGSCADVNDAELGYGSDVRGGWSMSWAQWPNEGRGGAVCTRTLRYAHSGWVAQ